MELYFEKVRSIRAIMKETLHTAHDGRFILKNKVVNEADVSCANTIL